VLQPDRWGGDDIRLEGVCIPTTCPDLPAGSVPATTRDAGVELIGQALGSGFLAGTMRAPLGTAILVTFMSSSGTLHEVEPAFVAVLVITNFVAVAVNPDSAIGQKGF